MLNRYFNFTRGNFLALVLFRNQILFTILVLRHADSFESMGNGDPRPLDQLLMKEEVALKRMYAKYMWGTIACMIFVFQLTAKTKMCLFQIAPTWRIRYSCYTKTMRKPFVSSTRWSCTYLPEWHPFLRWPHYWISPENVSPTYCSYSRASRKNSTKSLNSMPGTK